MLAMHADPVTFDQLVALCAEAGVVLDQVTPALHARLQLLSSTTETVRDILNIVKNAHAIFRYYEAHKPEQRWSENEKQVVVIGSLFADIGKTGPLHADAAEQRLISEMFAVEGVRDPRQPVADFLRASFPHDAERRVQLFAGLGLDPEMPMRAFWNLHAGWTLEIVREGGVPEEAMAAAASHHLLDNVNPERIVGEDGRYSAAFGENLHFDRAEKLVILLDKYDALRRRSGSTHEQAVAWLRKRLGDHARSRDDAEFNTLLDDLDVATRPGRL
jgi:hypothetical protein